MPDIPPRHRLHRWLAALLLAAFWIGCGVPAVAQGSSLILRLRPGVDVKPAMDVISSALHRTGSSVLTRPFIGSHGNRSILSATRLDRYLVVRLVGIDVDSAIGTLLALQEIEDVFRNRTYHINSAPNDSLYAEQWGLDRINIEPAWEISMGDTSVTVAWVDTGVDPDHPDLAGAFALNQAEDINRNGRCDPWPQSQSVNGVTGDLDGLDQDGNGYTDDVTGFDFVDLVVPNVGDWSARDPDPFDENGHGTNVAGIIGARRNNRIGIAGVAPGVRLLPIRAFDATGNAEDDDVAAAIVFAVQRGARVINLSFGDYFASPLLHDAIRYASLHRVVVVASSGNEGVNDPHYPSSFPEVISVGATNRDDNVSVFSTYGSQLSVTAPGSGIVTTAADNRYTTVGGTSFSAPHVAGVAALLLSLHPSWGADEVRTVLELSAHDIGRPGWDIISGAGRVDALGALEYPGPAVVAIGQPVGDAGFSSGQVVSVIGSVIAPYLESWSLSYGAGESPASWTPVVENGTGGRLNDSLGSFSTSALPSGIYTLRLGLVQTNGRSTDRRLTFTVNNGSPNIVSFDTGNVWRFDQRGLSLVVGTDQLTRMRLLLRRSGAPSTDAWSPIDIEPERWGWRRLHQLLLTDAEMQAGVPYDGMLALWSNAGDTLRVGDTINPLRLMRAAEAFPTVGFAQRNYTLPYGYVLNRVEELYDDGTPVVALNRFKNDGDFGDLTTFGFNGTSFVLRDSVAEQLAPRDIGDVDGDGRPDLLAQSFGTGVVFAQEIAGGSLFNKEIHRDTEGDDFYGARLYDFDGDGRDEIVARTSNQDNPHYYVSRLVGNRLERIADLPNTSSPGAGEAISFIGPPVVEIEDFNGNGRPDVLFGDEDGDFLLYEYGTDGQFRELWRNESDGFEGSEFVASGDVNGDGHPDAILATHTRVSSFVGQEHQPAFWTVRVFTFAADGSARLLWSDRAAYIRPTNRLRSGIESGDLDGRPGDEVVLSIFPNLYILRWDSAAATMRPFWWKSGTVGNRPIIADFDRDGINEVGVGDGRAIRFHQVQADHLVLESPAGLAAWALNDSTAHVEWLPATGAEFYSVYRARSTTGGGLLFFEAITTTAATTLLDTGLVTDGGRLDAGFFYHYIVTSGRSVPVLVESPRGDPARVYTHPPARIVRSLGVDARSFQIWLGHRVRQGLYRPGSISVVSAVSGVHVDVETLVTSGDSSLLGTLSRSPIDSIVVRPTWMLRDFDGTPADTTIGAVLLLPRDEPPGERFIATRAAPRSATSIEVEFNASVDAATLSPGDFVLEPSLVLSSVGVDPLDARKIILELDASTPIGPLGRDYIVRISNIASVDGRSLNDGAGSVVGFTVNAEDLADVFAFPQPYSLARDISMTFAGLTRIASVEIYTQSGAPVRSLRATDGNGGVQWDGHDDLGRTVATGVYIYQVVTVDSGGAPLRSTLRKLVVMP